MFLSEKFIAYFVINTVVSVVMLFVAVVLLITGGKRWL